MTVARASTSAAPAVREANVAEIRDYGDHLYGSGEGAMQRFIKTIDLSSQATLSGR
jgi:hypothetical protein